MEKTITNQTSNARDAHEVNVISETNPRQYTHAHWQDFQPAQPQQSCAWAPSSQSQDLKWELNNSLTKTEAVFPAAAEVQPALDYDGAVIQHHHYVPPPHPQITIWHAAASAKSKGSLQACHLI